MPGRKIALEDEDDEYEDEKLVHTIERFSH
jgi:hypothetical protein